MTFCQTSECITVKIENDQLPCCTNYFWENGKCKECPPGYFGKNCSSLCEYPNYGQHCQNTCDCNVTDCNHVDGCYVNYSQIEISTAVGLPDVTPLFSIITWSTISSTGGDKTNKNNKDKKKSGFDSSTLAIILVGFVLLCLFVLTGVPWISKFIRRNCTYVVNAEDNDIYRLETVYMEINAESDQQESQTNTIGATVLTNSCTSLDGEETRPELPARNNQDQKTNTTHTNKDDETDNVQN
ncbi:uncharacterized protein LOC128191721 [Crassostrea angulata]|uniref:uncharacterized protein LOC128191721 n=1 Tax=Magallana angulata TaxID=2784310 RepID=UPI0022B13CC0|nr:uncharacterized protein LOC128191721 [Crassostrea angulata]